MTVSFPRPAPAVAAKSRIYIFDKGYMCACHSLASQAIPVAVSIHLSLRGKPFEVELTGHRASASGFVVWPGVWRRTQADIPLVSIGLSAANPWYRTISTLKRSPALLTLARADFFGCDDAIEAAYDGQLSARDAMALSDTVMKKIAADLPVPRPLDARIQRVMSMVEKDVRMPMDKLAEDIHLSYHRLSHLFTDSMGISLRSFVLSRKLDAAFTMASQGMNLTEIAAAAGFSDSAHFSRAWMRSGGVTPSCVLDNDRITIRSSFNGQ